jgi:hypothetical protein
LCLVAAQELLWPAEEERADEGKCEAEQGEVDLEGDARLRDHPDQSEQCGSAGEELEAMTIRARPWPAKRSVIRATVSALAAHFAYDTVRSVSSAD